MVSVSSASDLPEEVALTSEEVHALRESLLSRVPPTHEFHEVYLEAAYTLVFPLQERESGRVDLAFYVSKVGGREASLLPLDERALSSSDETAS